MFMGEYHHSVDSKNRAIIPAKFRYELGEKFIITRGIDKCLFAYSMQEWQQNVNKLKNLPYTKKDARNFSRLILSGATLCEFDKQGRITITSPLMNYADITKDIVIIGVNDRLEIWSESNWNIFLEENDEKLADIAENLFTNEVFNETL